MTIFVAHRGDPVSYRENTLPAFSAAEKAGAHMLELDVQLSKDGQCVILHDDRLNRLWNVDAAVEDITFSEIQRVTSGDPYDIPLLHDVLSSTSIPLMIDVKDESTIDPIADVLAAHDAVARALVVGGNVHAHRRARKRMPDVQLGLTWNDATPPGQELLRECRFQYFNPPWWLLLQSDLDVQRLDPDVVPHMKEQGIGLSVWTVDNVEVMWDLVNIGADVIISNRVADLRSAFEARQK